MCLTWNVLVDMSQLVSLCSPTHASRSEKYLFVYYSEEEKDLNDTVIFYSRRGFPFTDLKLRKLAYELAVANKRKGFSPVKKMAGPWWLKGFLVWWPGLKKKNAKNLSLHRASCANAFQVAKFFRLYKQLLEEFELNYKPYNIWNIDETRIPDIPKEQKVIGVKGQQCSQTVSGEKPVNTTLLTFVSAGGMAMPPMIIFKGSKVELEARDAAPSGWMIRHSKTGYIQTKQFVEMGEKLIEFIREKKLDNNGKHLLLLDSHSSHSFNLHFMCFMQGHGVEVLCSPPPLHSFDSTT